MSENEKQSINPKSAWKKKILLALGIPALLLIALLIVARIPVIQKLALTKAMDSQVDTFSVDSVSVGITQAKINGLKLEKDGLSVHIPNFETKFSPFAPIFSKTITIRKLALNNLELDLSELQKKETPETQEPTPQEPFPGIFPLTQFGFKTIIEELNLSGTVTPATGQSLTYKITGGKIAPGTQGAINIVQELSDTNSNAPVKQLKTESTIQIDQNENGYFTKIALDTKLGLKHNQFKDLPTLHLKFQAEPENNNATEKAGLVNTPASNPAPETIGLNISAIDASGIEAEILNLNTRFQGRSGTLRSEFTLAADQSLIPDELIPNPIPNFSAELEGLINANIATPNLELETRLNISINQLSKVDPRLQTIGQLLLSAGTNISFKNKILNAEIQPIILSNKITPNCSS